MSNRSLGLEHFEWIKGDGVKCEGGRRKGSFNTQDECTSDVAVLNCKNCKDKWKLATR